MNKKLKILNRGIGIAEKKLNQTRRDRWGGNAVFVIQYGLILLDMHFIEVSPT